MTENETIASIVLAIQYDEMMENFDQMFLIIMGIFVLCKYSCIIV